MSKRAHREVYLTALLTLAGAGALAPFAGCSGDSGNTRVISGQLQSGAYTLDRAVVLAQSTSLRVHLASVAADGSFRLALPAGETYRLVLSNTTASGSYQAISRLTWATPAGRTHWVEVAAGGEIVLGGVRPAGSAP